MDRSGDFVRLLDSDVSFNIFTFLNDPTDIVYASAVSRTWRRFVISNGFCKKLCFRLYPEVFSALQGSDIHDFMEPVMIGPRNLEELEVSKKDHKVFAFLARGLSSDVSPVSLEAIKASSTDNYPTEGINNTLESNYNKPENRATYWSSAGNSDPSIPERLTYKLLPDLGIVSEINIQPFQAFFQPENPIYSAKAVRFRMGHLKSSLDKGNDLLNEFAIGHKSANDFIAWTYESPEFSMVHENQMQNFKLPQPVLCIGGIVQIELLGRVQVQEVDSLYYICVSHVQVIGRTLSPAFEAEVIDHSRKCVLKFCPKQEIGSNGVSLVDVVESSGRRFNAKKQLPEWNWERLVLNKLFETEMIAYNSDSDDEDFMLE